MVKKVKILLASIFAMLAFSNAQASALSFVSLDKTSEDSEFIEFNTPSEGYHFDISFLASEQTLEYKATIKNDEDYNIKINSISLAGPEHDFIEFSYDGISEGEVFQAGSTRTITVSVKTNDKTPSSVLEEYDLHVSYETTIPDNPPTFSETILPLTILFVAAGAIALFVTRTNSRRRYFVVLLALPIAGAIFLHGQANAVNVQDLHIKGKVSYIETFNVTVDPNGGIYQNNTEPTVTKVRNGEKYHVDEATRDTFNFVKWEINPSDLEIDNNGDIEIHSDTNLKALWDEVYYTLTIKPNGGKYNGVETDYTESFRPHEYASISTPEKTGYDFKYWTNQDNETWTGDSLQIEKNTTLTANYEIKHLRVTVNPNGGKYKGSTNVYTATLDYGTELDLTDVEYTDHEIKNWTKNVTDTLPADTEKITIVEDTDLIANWWSSIFHTVTIIPNGGVYDNKTETSTYQVREGTKYTMLEATRAGWLFDYWHYTDTETQFSGTEFVVEHDVSLTAEWAPIIARIERTGKLYSSIMKAEAEAITDDIITLLVDTTEIVTNEKKVTLDLYSHTVTGYIINTAAGHLTLINGEVNNYDSTVADTANPTGAAVVNNGTLIMGVNDYQGAAMNETVPLIDNDNIRLIGSEVGLEQNGYFYFYDGHIEGIVGLNGGYDGSPWYRQTFDGVVVNYFPFVTHNITKDCQHVELSNADKAVSKTIEKGAIYYYNLQDNINTSVRTGYKIYAVRDFDASYPISVPADEEIVFDIIGYEVNLGDDVTINGKLTIINSEANSDDPGFLTTSKTIQNNGDLIVKDTTIEAITTNTLMSVNSGKLTLTNSILRAEKGTALYVPNVETNISLDANSKIITESASPAIDNNSTTLTINNGTIQGTECVVLNNKDKSFTFSTGTIKASVSAVCNYGGTFTMNSGSINTENTGNKTIYGIYTPSNKNGGTINIKGGTIKVTSTGGGSAYAYGIYQYYGDSNISGGLIDAEGTGYYVDGFLKYYGKVNMTGGHIKASGGNNVHAKGISFEYGGGPHAISGKDTLIEAYSTGTNTNGYSAHAIYTNSVTLNITDATIKAESANYVAYGINSYQTTVNIYGDTHITAHSATNNAFGVGPATSNTSYAVNVNMENGSISATADASGKTGIGINANTVKIYGGTVYGNAYGIHGALNSVTSSITLGKNESPLYNGVDTDTDGNVYPATPEIKGGINGITGGNVYFYDGILKGGSAYVNDTNIIKAIPDGTSRIVTRLEDPVEQDCWLEYDEDYLQLPDGSTYNSLTGAYDNVEDGETITVIRDASTPAVLPANNKNITIDLNGHKLNYTQPLTNNGTMHITDSSSAKTGAITNNSWATDRFINNNGTLTIDAGDISGTQCTVYNTTGKTVTFSNGSIKGIASAVCNYGGTFTMNSGTVSTERNGETNTIINPYNYTGVININGGNIKTKQLGNANTRAINADSYNVTINMTGGDIEVTNLGTSGWQTYGLHVYGVVNITGGHIKVTSDSTNEAGAIYNYSGTTTIDGANTLIEAYNTRTGAAYGVYKSSNNVNLKNGTIKSESNTGNSVGIWIDRYYTTTANITGGSIIAHSTGGNAWGVTGALSSSREYSNIVMTAGSISATADASNRTGIGLTAKNVSITGGTIYGNTYGIDGKPDFIANVTLGKNENPLYNGINTDGEGHVYPATPEIKGGLYGIRNGYIYFYDGIIKGGTTYVDDPTIIKAIPDGTSRVIVDLNDPVEQDCWLEYDEDYLQLPDGSTYNSLTSAYNHVQDGDTITVIRDASTPAVLPANERNIIIDLNGHTLNYSQPLKNNGTMVITDSSTAKTGAIINNSWATDRAIDNAGTLTINAGTITGTQCTVYNNSGKTFNFSNGSIRGIASAVCNYGGTFNMSSGSVSSERNGETNTIYGPYNYGGTINITGGSITTVQSGANNYARGIYTNTYNGALNVSNATIEVTNTGTSGGYSTFGIYANNIATVSNTHIKVTSSMNNDTIGIYSYERSLTVDGANTLIEVYNTGSSSTYGIYKHSGTLDYSNGTIKSESKTGEADGIWIYRYYTTTANISGGNITAHSTAGNAYGINGSQSSSYERSTVNMTNGSVSATADAADRIGVGIAAKYINVTGGIIYGNTYGIHGSQNLTSEITIGKNEDPLYNGINTDGEGHVYPATPEIKGGVYGIYNGNVYFYDGILKGATSAYFDRNVKKIADNTYMHGKKETIGDVEYDVKYLANEEVLAKIGNDEYYTLQAAVNAAEEGDEIDLAADNYIFYTLTIPADKKIIIDLNGYEVVTGNQIINNGDVAIYDSTGAPKLLDYREANYFFTNQSGAKLKIDGIDIKARFGFDNKANATLTLNNLKIGETSYSEKAIENRGTLNLDNITADATYIALYTLGGELDIKNSAFTTHRTGNSEAYTIYNEKTTGTISDNTTITLEGDSYYDGYRNRPAYYQAGATADVAMTDTTIDGFVRIEAGSFSATTSTLKRSIPTEYNRPLIYNKGTATLTSSTVSNTQIRNYEGEKFASAIINTGTLTIAGGSITSEITQNAYYATTRIISNSGTLDIDGATIGHSYSNPANNYNTKVTVYGIYNVSGTTSLKDSTISVERHNAYGVYAEAGDITIKSGSVIANSAENAFGVWAKNGSITLGEAEPTNSPNYGTANAVVSTTSPLIQAYGATNGIAVTIEGGSFNFYDGKIIQTSTIGPAVQADHVSKATITNVEYLYQPETHTDDEDHTYFILEFMR